MGTFWESHFIVILIWIVKGLEKSFRFTGWNYLDRVLFQEEMEN